MFDARTEARRALRPLAIVPAACALALLGALVTYAPASGEAPAKVSTRTEAVTLVGLTPGGVERVAYAPGASRSWSASERIVGVAVLSGTLTLYGPTGERQVYAAGEGFAAGWMAHRAANETDDPVETLITSHRRP